MSDYAAILNSAGLGTDLRGPWAVYGLSNRQQGWKLHVSSIPIEAPRLLMILLPYLMDAGVSFKIARDELTLFLLNEGKLGGTQIGKFATIYPSDDVEARELAIRLLDATAGMQGPIITTDFRLGDVVYARHGGFNPDVRRDRLGQISLMLKDADGVERRDQYVVPFVPPRGVANPFEGLIRAAPKATEHQTRLLGPGYRLLETLRPNPKGSTFLALDLRSQEQIALKVIKEGRQHCLSDRYGRDIRTRLRHQEALHIALRGRADVPAVDPYFEVSGHGYLPMAFVPGRDLGAIDATPFGRRALESQRAMLADLTRVCRAVRRLHEAGIVHRDLTYGNLRRTPDGEVMLLDLELAFVLDGSDPPFSQGTPGFMSPQQAARETPATNDDTFSIGAVMVLLLCGVDPRRVLFAGHEARAAQIRALGITSRSLASLVAACVDPHPSARPTVCEIADALEHSVTNTSSRPSAKALAACDKTRARAKATVPAIVRGLLDATRRTPGGLWLSPSIDGRGHATQEHASSYQVHRSINRGVAGTVYALSRMSRSAGAIEIVKPRIESAVDWLLEHVPSPDDQMPGLHFGEAGVAVAVCEAVGARLLDRGPWLNAYLSEALNAPLDWPDLTHGAAGQGLAALLCADVMDDPALEWYAERAARLLIDQQDADGGWTLPEGVDGLAGVRYSGFAHGVAGITFFLAEHGGRTGDGAAIAAAESGAEWLTRAAIPTAGGASLHWAMSETHPERWHWWCHGGPGIALTFLRLFEWFGDPRYSAIATRALGTHPVDLRYSNLSQCHGLSGLGEIYLEAARGPGESSWMERAANIVETILALGRDSQHGLTWLVEDPVQPTADLMVGCGGVGHFLWRFTNSVDSSPPLLPDAVESVRRRQSRRASALVDRG